MRRETKANFERIYLYSSDGIIGYEENGERFIYRKNLFGDITAIYQGTDKVAEYAYDAWGNCTITYDPDGYGASNPIRYRGYYWDSDLGMYYLMTRYYDPKTGRFINADTLDYLDPNTINGLNLYAYCANNPVMYVDPIGHEPLSIALSMLGEFIVPLALLALLGIAIALVVKKSGELLNNKNESIEEFLQEHEEFRKPPTIYHTPVRDYHEHLVPVTVNDVANFGSNIGGYVGNFGNIGGGRLNNPSTYTSKYGGKYDSFNSGNWVGYGGLGSWGEIMERFLDEYGIPNFD